MENIMLKRKLILENGQKTITNIYNKCNETNFVKEWKETDNKTIKQYKIKDNSYLYRLTDEKNSLKGVIVSPIELKGISKADFEEEDYFAESNNRIGYATNIDSGIWLLLKKNEIRCTLKNANKKIAVIQFKEIYTNNIEQKVFSYSNKIENVINNAIEDSNNILDILSNIIEEKELQKELNENKSVLDNKSLRLLIKEFDLELKSLLFEGTLEQECTIEKKIREISMKYEKICMQLKTETDNMKFNTTDETSENRALVLIEENSMLKTIKEISRAIIKLLKSNVFERENDDVKIRR